MIVPGLDRIEGTAVSPKLLNTDDLWEEHTLELMQSLDEENSLRSAEERLTMIEFAAA